MHDSSGSLASFGSGNFASVRLDKVVKRFAQNSILVGISCAIAILLVEGLIRLLSPASVNANDVQFHSVLGWQYKAGQYWERGEASLLAHEIYIGPLGLRANSGFNLDPSGHFDAIVLGDSFAFARAVPSDATFVSQLQFRLSAETGEFNNILNAGVEGFGTAQQLLLARELVARGVSADLYVLQMFTNDLLDNLRLDYGSLEPRSYQPLFELSSAGQLVLHAPVEPEHPINSPGLSVPRLETLRVLKDAVASLVQSNAFIVKAMDAIGVSVPLPRMPGLLNAWYQPDIRDGGLRITRAILIELKAEIEARGGRLVVTSIPSPLSVYPEVYGPILRGNFPEDSIIERFIGDPMRSEREYAALASEIGLEYVDTSSKLMAAKAAGSLYIPRDGHLTKLGHKVVAEALAAYLVNTQAAAPKVAPGVRYDVE